MPASHTQDIAGPLARTVTDLAVVLDAIIGPDPADPVTLQSAGRIPGSFLSHLDGQALQGARIGVLEPFFGDQPEDLPVGRLIRTALEDMEKQGAEVVSITVPDLNSLLEGASVPRMEFRFDFNAYLARTPGARVRSLTEILDKGLYHAAVDEALRRADAVPDPDTEEYRAAMAKRQVARRTIVDAMDDHRVIALAYPSLRRTAAFIGEPQRGGNCSLSSVTDLPAITVPAGFVPADGLPAGLELLGRPFADADLVKLAFSYEQVTRHRRPPATTPDLARPARSERFTVRATGSGHVPPVATNTDAVLDVTYDAGARRLDYTLRIGGPIAADLLAIHLHRGDPGARGPVVQLLGAAGRLTAAGSATLGASDDADLRAGRLYLDLHTREHPDGEARAQLPAVDPRH
jgi:hypothetical protein